MKKSLRQERMKNMMRNYSHPAYSLEKKVLKAITLCQLDLAKQTMETINALERATLSSNPIRSKKNSLIVWCALTTRAVIDAGVDFEDAFVLSDVLINQIDRFKEMKDLQGFEFEIIEESIRLIQTYNQEQYAYPISAVVKYIRMNASNPISVRQLAMRFKMHPDYLSKRFHSEVGVTLIHFAQAQKVALAKHYLELTNMSLTDISILIGFSSSAYFSRVFKQHETISPKEYRQTIRQNK